MKYMENVRSCSNIDAPFFIFFRRLFDDAFLCQDYVPPDGIMIVEWGVKTGLEGSGHGITETLTVISVNGRRKS
jgi:hypothetical protein